MASMRMSTSTTTGCFSYPRPNPTTTTTSFHYRGILGDLVSYHYVDQMYILPYILHLQGGDILVSYLYLIHLNLDEGPLLIW